jgi:Nif-specific regulatory protein
VRLIAATNRDLREATAKQEFRADLFYRVSVFPIVLPPLRARRDDVRLLALHFLRRFAEKEGKDVPGIDPEALRLLEEHPWPGNVRELANVVRRLVLSAEPGERIPPELVWPWLEPRSSPRPTTNGSGSLRERVRQAEVEAIDQALREHDYNRTRAAQSLGVTREWLWTKMRRLGFPIRRSRSRADA